MISIAVCIVILVASAHGLNSEVTVGPVVERTHGQTCIPRGPGKANLLSAKVGCNPRTSVPLEGTPRNLKGVLAVAPSQLPAAAPLVKRN